MTTKEFQRRCFEFSKLNQAVHFFENKSFDSIFKLTLIRLDGQLEVHYVTDTLISKLSPYDYSGVWFDRFTRKDFEIQYKYFLAFVNRLSKHQYDVMCAKSGELGLSYLVKSITIKTPLVQDGVSPAPSEAAASDDYADLVNPHSFAHF